MDSIFGLSMQKIVEALLGILAMVFFLIAGRNALDEAVLLSIIVAVYLIVVVLLTCARRDNMLNSNVVGLECSLGVLLLLCNIALLKTSMTTLVLIGVIMEIVLGALFLIFAIF